METTMLSKALREFLAGPHNQLLVNIAGKDGKKWEEAFKRFLRKENPWPEQSEKEQLFEFVRKVSIPESGVVVFCASRRFVVDTADDAQTRISRIDRGFQKHFLQGVNDKLESLIPAHTLKIQRFLRFANNYSIITELGGSEYAEVPLSTVFLLMKAQRNAEPNGALLVDGQPNIFYVKDSLGYLQAVAVSWNSGGWDISGAYGNISRVEWGPGAQVFSIASLDI